MSLERPMEDLDLSAGKPRVATAGRYLTAVIGGAVAALGMFCALYGTLYITGTLPPPPLSNNVCTDEKLVFLRDNPPADPNFLVIGSSVAWRNIDSAVIAREVSGASPLNGGFCGMQVHQSAFLADWMTDRWPSVQQLLLVVSPLDFDSCRGTGQVFDPADADRFVFERKALWSFYLRYFDPVSLIRNVKRQAKDREHARAMNMVRGFTKYADGPLDTTRNRGLFYGEISKTDPACFEALHTLAVEHAGQNRRLLVVVTPIHPGWKSRYDPDGAFGSRFSRQVTAALEGTGAEVWNADQADILDASAFTDAVHVRWSAAGRLTEEIVHKFHL